MKQQHLAIIVGIIFVMAFMYWNDNNSNVENIRPTVNSVKVVEANKSETQNPPTVETPTAEAGVAPAVVAAPLNESSVKFVQTLKTLGQCLQIKNQVEGVQIDPTFDNLVLSLRPVLGDITVYTDDWAQSDIQFNDGAQKRIRTEVNYDNPGEPIKYLQVYNIENMGVPEAEEINPQQATNPSDEYIESLKAGANVLLHEKGGRAYFQGGEEIVIIERNGKIESITMSKNNKTISCSSMTTADSSCQCF